MKKSFFLITVFSLCIAAAVFAQSDIANREAGFLVGNNPEVPNQAAVMSIPASTDIEIEKIVVKPDEVDINADFDPEEAATREANAAEQKLKEIQGMDSDYDNTLEFDLFED